MTVALWWLRRDLRLTDNRSLDAALRYAARVVPVWIYDPALLNAPTVGAKRLAFLNENLRSLDEALRRRGSHLVVRRGNPLDELATLMDETGATAIYATADHSPYARRRDGQVAEAFPLHLVDDVTVHPPGSVRKADGTPYVVYTPFSRTWKALPLPRESDLLPAPDTIPTPAGLTSEAIPDEPALPDTVPFPAGEEEAQRRLHAFADDGIFAYKQDRDRMDLDGTSRLSPYLRFGVLSPRQATVAARQAIADAPDDLARKGAETWLNELIWRDFYVHILYHHPQVLSGNFREKYDDVAWRNDEADFDAWCTGRTGYPVVDAAMRQLQQSGWMHNRARMIVASFLTKDLLIDWRRGERWFMQHLVDGDPAANNGGWQWSAGTGTDAAPYFRIFNPVSQGKKHDPHGDYVRRWLPELADVPPEFIHEPWRMPRAVQEAATCRIGEAYPAPIVDHSAARERTLAAYKAAA